MIKLAVTKYIKLFREGKLSGEALAKIVNLHGKEKFIKEIGAGAEAVADLIASPKFSGGLGVRKAYNPSGLLFSNRFFLKKDKAWKALGGKSGFAGYYGKHPTAPVTYHEYIPGFSEEFVFSTSKAGIKATATALLRGRRVSDIIANPSNIISGKVVDFLPKVVDKKELPIAKMKRRVFKEILKDILGINKNLSTNTDIKIFNEALLGGPSRKTIRRQAFKHQVKKEKLTPGMILRRVKPPLFATGAVVSGALIINKEQQN